MNRNNSKLRFKIHYEMKIIKYMYTDPLNGKRRKVVQKIIKSNMCTDMDSGQRTQGLRLGYKFVFD